MSQGRATPRDVDAAASSATDARMAWRLTKYLMAYRGLFGATMLLYPLNALTVILPPYLVQQILDVAIPGHDSAYLGWLAGAYVLALVVEYGSGFASEFAMSVLGLRAMQRLRLDMFAHVQKLPAAFFDVNPIGRTLTRLTTDVEALAEVFSSGAITIIADIITVIAVVSTMLWLDVRLTLFAFLVVPPLVILAAVFQRYARRAFRSIRRHIARINTFLAEHLAAMSVVQVFRQEARTQQEFAGLNADYRDANRQAIFFDASLYSVVEAIGTCAVAAMIWYGAQDMTAGLVRAGTLVAFIQYIRRFFVPIRDLSTKYTVLQSAFAASERVFSLLDEKLGIEAPKDSVAVARMHDGIALDDVWFAYREPRDDRDWILRGITLRVARGERVALVGSTGAGKTTVLKLLNRFYDVRRGAVRIDGIDIRQLQLTALRRLFAVVLQDVHLFSGTIMDNLAISDRVSRAAVEHAMHAIGADGFLKRLPKGYDTHVQELGANFSAGERQLLALARALAFNPDVLILDEATSNIDSETEAHIQSALDVVLKDRTAVIVAHRLSTIQKVDRIIVLQHGRVVEEGSHQALMQKDGAYRKLVELQFSQSADHPPPQPT